MTVREVPVEGLGIQEGGQLLFVLRKGGVKINSTSLKTREERKILERKPLTITVLD